MKLAAIGEALGAFPALEPSWQHANEIVEPTANTEAERLLDEQLLATVPGTAFGDGVGKVADAVRHGGGDVLHLHPAGRTSLRFEQEVDAAALPVADLRADPAVAGQGRNRAGLDGLPDQAVAAPGVDAHEGPGRLDQFPGPGKLAGGVAGRREPDAAAGFATAEHGSGVRAMGLDRASVESHLGDEAVAPPDQPPLGERRQPHASPGRGRAFRSNSVIQPRTMR